MIGRLRSLKICLGDAIRHLGIRFHLIWRRVRVFLLELAFDVSSKEVVENFGLKRVTILLLGLDLPLGQEVVEVVELVSFSIALVSLATRYFSISSAIFSTP